MRRMSPRPLSLALASVLALACNRGSETGSDGGQSPESSASTPAATKLVGEPAADVSKDTAKLLAAVGSEAPAVLVFRDEGIAALGERLPKLLPAELLADASKLTGVTDAGDLLKLLADTAEIPVRPVALKGRDVARPVVVSAFETPVSGPPGMAVGLMSALDGYQPPLRYQVVLPATDVTALLKSVQKWLPEDTIARPELVAGLEGALGLQLKRKWPLQTFIALVPEDSHLRVVVLHDGRGTEDASKLRARVDVKSGDLPDTPALRHAGRDDHAVAALVRPWQLRSLGVWTGLSATLQAVDTVGSDQYWMAMIRGTAITATAEVLSPDDRAEFDDWSFALTADRDSVRMSTVASLTPTGQKIWDAAQTELAPAPKLQSEVEASITMGMNLAAALRTAKGHTLREGSMGDLARTFQNCGVTCPMFSMLRWPAAALRTFTPEVREAGTGISSAQLALPSLDEPTTLGVAVVGDDLPAAEVFESAIRGFVFGKTSVQVKDGKHGGHPALLVGNGLDPATIFELDAHGPESTALLRAEGALPKRLGGSGLRSAMHRAGPALAFEVVLGPGELRPLVDYSGTKWNSPLGSGPATKASGCLHELAWVLVDDVNSLAMVARDQRSLVAMKAASEIKPLLACAVEDPKIEPAARSLVSWMTVAMARTVLDTPDYPAARDLLEFGCPEGQTEGLACKELAGLADTSPPTIPEGTLAEQCRPEYDDGRGMPVLVHGGGVFIAGRKVGASPSAIADAVVELTTMSGRAEKSGPTLGLWVDAAQPFSAVEPILVAAGSLRSNLRAVFNDDRGDRGWAAVPIEWPKTLSIDWKVHPDYESEEPFAGGYMDEPRGGLYASKKPTLAGPGSTVVHTLMQTRGSLVVIGDGKKTPLANASELMRYVEGMHGRGGPGESFKVEWKVAADVPWREVVEVLIASCTDLGTLVLTPMGTP